MDIQNTSNINLTDDCDKHICNICKNSLSIDKAIDNLQSIDILGKSTDNTNNTDNTDNSTNINYTNYLSSDYLDGCENWGIDG